MEVAAKEVSYISVSDLTRALNATLERQFPEVFFQGEISQVMRARSGHLYFTVKDEDSQLSAVMWAGMAAGLEFEVEPGLSVLCHGRPNVYRGSGKLQIVVHRLIPAGEGALRKKFLELKAKLEKEGLFSVERKRKLPFLPRAVGVITSRSGAVIHDIMVRIQERMPQLQVYLVDVKVQGEGAAADIAAAIKFLDAQRLVDVIIVARGGGSLEDLWAFNEEPVVRAIFASGTPIITGIGHEVDVTLSDFAADMRAATPTAAAEIVVPRRDALLEKIGDYERRLMDSDRWLQPLIQSIDERSLRLDSWVRGRLEQSALRIEAATARLKMLEPHRLMENLKHRIELAQHRLATSAASVLERAQAALEQRFSRLGALNPRRVLERGFSIVESAGKIVRSADELVVNDAIKVSLWRGAVAASVTEKLSKE